MIFETRGLNAFYGKSQVIHALDLTVRRGQIVVILGRNGVGKTSLMMSIAGLVRGVSDRLELDGEDLRAMLPYRRVRKGLAMVPSGSRAFGNLTVEENLVTVYGRTVGSSWTVDRVYERFPRLAERRRSLGGNLSGGERQMLAIGRAMLAQPSLLMMDEPSEGLAPLIVQHLIRTLKELTAQNELGVLLTEQNHEVALNVADHVHFMEKGQLVWSGTPAEARAAGAVERFLGI